VTGPAHPVSWAPGPAVPPGAAWPVATRPSLSPVAVLRVLAGALLGLAAALVAVGTFPGLMSIGDGDHSYELSGWHESATGSLSADPMHLGIPLAVAAAVLLAAAGLTTASLWRPRLRPGALTATVAAAGLITVQFWAIDSYVEDIGSLAHQAGASLHTTRGAGFWLELTGMVLGLLALVLLVAAELAALRRPAADPAVPAWAPSPPVAGPPDWGAEPVAGPPAWEGAR
jgi:hypothetical protein